MISGANSDAGSDVGILPNDETQCNLANAPENRTSFEEWFDPLDKVLLVKYYARKYHDLFREPETVPSDIIQLIANLFPRLSDEYNAIAAIPRENRVMNIDDVWNIEKTINQGGSATVYLAEPKQKNDNNKTQYALKKLDRQKCDQGDPNHLFLREYHILRLLKHPNIMEIDSIYMDKSSYAYYIVSPYYPGGEFFDLILEQEEFTEEQALKYIIPILLTLEYNFM